jgi:hypothetical protein
LDACVYDCIREALYLSFSLSATHTVSLSFHRHLKIIFDINLFFLQDVERRWPGDRDRLRRMSIIEEGAVQKVLLTQAHTRISVWMRERERGRGGLGDRHRHTGDGQTARRPVLMRGHVGRCGWPTWPSLDRTRSTASPRFTRTLSRTRSAATLTTRAHTHRERGILKCREGYT